MESTFIKNGTKIMPFPKGLEYSLIPGKIYNLVWNDWTREGWFEEDGTITMPEKIYQTESDKLFIKRILTYFDKMDKLNLGVLLTGLKGSGKSLTAKLLSKKSNLPIIVVSPTYPANELTEMFTNFNTPCCILFDECDKNKRWNSNDMLGFLDGLQDTAKKLVIYTCNETCDLSQYLIDRCSRIKYCKNYEGINKETITQIANDLISNKDIIPEVVNFIDDQFLVKSYDNIISYIEEYEMFHEEATYITIAEDLNITLKDSSILNKLLEPEFEEEPDPITKTDTPWSFDKCNEDCCSVCAG